MRTDRCRKTRNGIVAFSPSLHCTKPNATVSRPKPTNRPIICEDPHGFLVPPHCSARSKQHTAANNSPAPTKSICCNFSLSGKLLAVVLSFLSFKKRKIRIRTTTPIGAFLVKSASVPTVVTKKAYIQKHHLQLAWSVSAPPRMGPKQTAKPKELTTIPMYSGLLSSGTEKPMIPRAPWNNPAAPTPAMARPRMKTDDFGAAAHKIEPTSATC